MRMNEMGVGIGTSAPTEALHVAGGGPSPFARARIQIQDENSSTAQRLLLHLKNNGGSRIDFQNTDNGERFTLKTDSAGNFIMGDRVAGVNQVENEPDTPEDAIHTGILGVGINTETPRNALHVFTDGVNGYSDGIVLVENASPSVANRDLFRLENNGGCRFRMVNSNSGGSWLFQSIASSGPITKKGACRWLALKPLDNYTIAASPADQTTIARI